MHPNKMARTQTNILGIVVNTQIKMISPINVELSPWYVQWLLLGVETSFSLKQTSWLLNIDWRNKKCKTIQWFARKECCYISNYILNTYPNTSISLIAIFVSVLKAFCQEFIPYVVAQQPALWWHSKHIWRHRQWCLKSWSQISYIARLSCESVSCRFGRHAV